MPRQPATVRQRAAGRLPDAAHRGHGWVIDRVAPDFRLLDAWALPAYGRREDFPAFVERVSGFDPERTGPLVVRLLFRVRLWVGARLGWDDPTKRRPIPGCTETTLAVRLPDHLRGSAAGAMTRAAGGFQPLYRTDDEWAAEISNETVHGVLHLAWVVQDDGRHRAQMGVYVKPRGRLGEVYLKLIEPFRHRIVYPALLRRVARITGAHADAGQPRGPNCPPRDIP